MPFGAVLARSEVSGLRTRRERFREMDGRQIIIIYYPFIISKDDELRTRRSNEDMAKTPDERAKEVGVGGAKQ